MSSILAHVPMSHQARTSVLDGWLRFKSAEKEWICKLTMLTEYSRVRATCECGLLLFLLVIQCNSFSYSLSSPTTCWADSTMHSCVLVAFHDPMGLPWGSCQ